MISYKIQRANWRVLAIAGGFFVCGMVVGVLSDAALDKPGAERQLDPDNVAIYNELGNALRVKGNLDDAIIEYRTAMRLNPANPDAHRNLGRALQAKGNLEGAIAEYRRALRLNPDDLDTRSNLGRALQAKGDLEGAIAEYRAALRVNPNNAEAQSNLGIALQVKHSMDQVIAEYGTTLRFKPPAVTRSGPARTLLAQGFVDIPIAEYRRIVQLEPEDADAHNNLGVLLQTKGHLADALAEYRAALHVRPNDPDVHYNLGSALLLTREAREEAAREFREFLRLAPDTPAGAGFIRLARAWLVELEWMAGKSRGQAG